jgi:hypothetical protein
MIDIREENVLGEKTFSGTFSGTGQKTFSETFSGQVKKRSRGQVKCLRFRIRTENVLGDRSNAYVFGSERENVLGNRSNVGNGRGQVRFSKLLE